MTLLVTGGRDYADRAAVARVLDAVHRKRPVALLREGGAAGADQLAREWAADRGVPVDTMPADWAKHGRAAGPIRNRAMLAREPLPDGVVAFPGGRGTADMVAAARAAGVTVWEPLVTG